MSLEFVRYRDGRCALHDGGEQLWSSDGDDDYLEEFDACIDSEEIDDVIDYLEESGYLGEDDSLDIVDESDPGTRRAHEWGDDEESDEDDESEGPWLH